LLVELKGDRPAVAALLDIPALGQQRFDRRVAGQDGDQRLVDTADHLDASELVGHRRVHRYLVGQVSAEDQRVLAADFGQRGGGRCGRRSGGGRCGRGSGGGRRGGRSGGGLLSRRSGGGRRGGRSGGGRRGRCAAATAGGQQHTHSH